MKKNKLFTFLATAFAGLGVAYAQELTSNDWTYFYSEEDSEYQVTDGTWTFKATVTGDLLTVNEVIGYPTEISQLDFSKPVTDADGNSYTISKLNPLFGIDLDSWKDVDTSEAGAYLGELVLPAEGLKTISSGAFGACEALTNVVNFLPDSVTSLGSAAFFGCSKLKGDLICRNVNNLTRCVFTGCSKLTQVTFGAGVRTIGNGSNKQGAFQNCNAITNIIFEADCKNINIRGYSFAGSLSFKSPVILYGVTNLSTKVFRGNKSFPAIVFDDCIKGIELGLFDGTPSNFSEVHFLGAPPDNYGIEFFGTELSRKIRTYVPHKYGEQWVKYSATGEINYKDTTFSADFVGEDYENRLLIWGDRLDSTVIVIK